MNGLNEALAGEESIHQGVGKMKLGDKVYELHNAFDVSVNTAEWLIENGKLRSSDCPVKVVRGRKRYLINEKPRHENGDKFRAHKKLSNGLYIETHFSRSGHEEYSRRLTIGFVSFWSYKRG